MDITYFVIVILAAIIIIFILQRYAAYTNKSSIPPHKAQDKVKAGALFIDVREPVEWDQGHASGSRHIPLNEFKLRFNDFPKNKSMVVICASGSRSLSAVKMLRKNGFEDSWSVRGGVNAWKHLGLPMAGVKKTKDPWR